MEENSQKAANEHKPEQIKQSKAHRRAIQ